MRKFITVAATAAMVGLGALTFTGTATAAPAADKPTPVGAQSAPCGKSAPDLDGRARGKWARTNAIIRQGSSTGCVAMGVLATNHYADYHCYTIAGGYTWTALRDIDSGIFGWVRDDLLTNGGSTVYCGF